MNMRNVSMCVGLMLALTGCAAFDPRPLPPESAAAPAPYAPPPTPQSTPPPQTAPAPAPVALPPPEAVGANAPLAEQRPLPVEGSDLTMEERALRRLAASAPSALEEPVAPAALRAAPKPLAPARPQPISGPTAKTLDGAHLRSRPVRSAQDWTPVTANTTARLVTPIKNADGEWWFVTITGVGGGWLLISELGDFAR